MRIPTTRRISRLVAVLAGAALVESAPAAAPKLDHLYPAGAQRGTSVAVTATGTFATWPAKVFVEGAGVTVKPGEKSGQLEVAITADAVPGVAWIRLHDGEGASAPKPFLIGALPETLEVEPNNEPAQAQKLEKSSIVVNGVLEKAGDVDGFAIPLKKGRTLVASLEAHAALGSPMDGVLQVVSPDGFVLAQNDDDGGFDPQIAFDVPVDGVYLVRTFAYPAKPNSTIGFAGAKNYVYRLTLTTGGFVDHPFPLAVTRFVPTDVQLHGWNVPAGAAFKAALPGAAADFDRSYRDGFANAVLLRVESRAIAIEAAPNDAEHPQELTLPVTVSGHVESEGDADFYRFSAKKGEKLRFRIESRSLGAPLDGVLRIRDAQGKVLQRTDDSGQTGGDPVATFAIPADGQYVAEIFDLHGRGGFRYAYRLAIGVPEPTFALGLAANRFVSAPGKPLEIPVTIERRDGFDREITILVQGLPGGVKAAPVASSPKGDTAKAVKIQLTCDATPFSGPIRIVGVSAEEAPLVRVAQATIEGVKAKTPNIWLTVPPPPAPKKKEEKKAEAKK